MILDTARELFTGIREERYGNPRDNYDSLAAIWTEIIGYPVKGEQVILALIAMKLMRYNYKPDLDDLVDIAGYAAVLEKMR